MLDLDEAIEWVAFGVWLTMLLHRHGENVLRVKGMLNVRGAGGPVVVHSVQHLVHPPVHLDHWPDDGRRSRLVFIARHEQVYWEIVAGAIPVVATQVFARCRDRSM